MNRKSLHPCTDIKTLNLGFRAYGLRHPGSPKVHGFDIGAAVCTLRLILVGGIVTTTTGCATLPSPSHRPFTFPKNAYFLPPKDQAYDVVGTVKSKVNYNALDQDHSEEALCSNYFNKAVGQLVKAAQEKGADAVVDVRSVVWLMDGRTETYPRPECSDDGEEGQAFVEALAVKWKKPAPLSRTP